jgi:hypothetical protein
MITINNLTIVNTVKENKIDMVASPDEGEMNEVCITTSVSPADFDVTFSGNPFLGNAVFEN